MTLDGLDAIDVPTIRKALADANADVRASAIRLSERWLATDQALKAAVLGLVGDKNWNVRRQAAASIGEIPAAERGAPVITLLTSDAAVTYIRRAWGHTGTPVDPLNVMEVRSLSKGRTKPWTDKEHS